MKSDIQRSGETLDPNRANIREQIAHLLAQRIPLDQAEFHSCLNGDGKDLVVDSFELIPIIPTLERELGIQVPNNKATTASYRSLRAFEEHIAQVAGEQSSASRAA